MRCLVTGVAGFIGSHVAGALLERGHQVAGLDCFTDYYGRASKDANLSPLRAAPDFVFHQLDLTRDDLGPALGDVEWVFHQAGQPGVRANWGDEFAAYLTNNVLATQRLLEAIVAARGVRGLVYASSSSIYGDAEQFPTREDALPRPISPYGVTKLAGEHLSRAYGATHGFSVAILRYFTVYGARQRPDMGFHRFIRAMFHGEPIDVYGDGRQTRDFTHVADIAAANLAAMDRGADGVFNIGGGSRVELIELLALIARLVGRPADLRFGPPQPGDVRHTGADTSAARQRLGYVPRVSLDEGVQQQVEWQRGLYGMIPAGG